MFFVSNKYAKIWKIFKTEEKYVDLSVSTSEKDRDGEFRNSNWRARAIGHAFQQYKNGEVSEGNQYAIRGKLTNERYQDDDGNWKDNYRLLIMDFGEAGTDIQSGDRVEESKANPPKKSSYEKKPASAAKKEKSDDPDDLPF